MQWYKDYYNINITARLQNIVTKVPVVKNYPKSAITPFKCFA